MVLIFFCGEPLFCFDGGIALSSFTTEKDLSKSTNQVFSTPFYFLDLLI